jgi:osmotically-inducible protein OsmY
MSQEPDPDAESLVDDIDHAVGESWYFDPQTIHVAVTAGKVILSGTVRSMRERRMAAAAAWAHEGVMEVENNLVIDA